MPKNSKGGCIMTNSVVIAIISLFLITSFTNILATLKTIFVSKKIMKPVYLVVFLDAMIFATIVTKVTSSTGVHFTLAYAFGKTVGVFIGGKVEERLALGILEVDLFLNNKDKMIQIAELLREAGYTVNNFLARGQNGDRGYKVEVVINRKEYVVLEDLMEECGIENPTLKIKNLSKVYGKISTTKLETI